MDGFVVLQRGFSVLHVAIFVLKQGAWALTDNRTSTSTGLWFRHRHLNPASGPVVLCIINFSEKLYKIFGSLWYCGYCYHCFLSLGYLTSQNMDVASRQNLMLGQLLLLEDTYKATKHYLPLFLLLHSFILLLVRVSYMCISTLSCSTPTSCMVPWCPRASPAYIPKLVSADCNLLIKNQTVISF